MDRRCWILYMICRMEISHRLSRLFLISSVMNPFLLFVAFAIYDAAGLNRKQSGEVIRLE